MYKSLSCKICSGQLRVIKRYKITNKTVWPWNEVYGRIKDIPFPLIIHLVMCRSCGFLFYQDTFSFIEMKQFYEEEARYTRPQKHKLKPGRLWELDRFIDFIGTYLPVAGLKSGLDLGAGDFIALERLTTLRPQIVFEAMDPSYPSTSHKGIKVYKSMLEDFVPTKKYDVVTAVHILEHINDVSQFMEKTSQLVKDGGYLYVEVPFQVGPSLFLNRSASVQHVNYFTPETISYLISRHSFCIENLVFDYGTYYRNGMLGMIHILAKKEKHISVCPSLLATVRYLFNPLPYFKRL